MKKFSLVAASLLLLNVPTYADKIREGVLIYQPNPNATAAQLKSLNGLLNSHVLSEIKSIDALNLKVVKLKETGKERAVSRLLRQTGAVKFAEPDMEITPTLNPNDPYFSNQWHHTTINTPLAWNTITAPNDIDAVKVCVLDTGVDTDHPDLIDNLLPGYNANGLASVEDDHGHGTGTAGVIGAVGNNGIGAAGVLWDVNIIPVQINISADNSSAYISTMADGIRWCADQGAKVANLSYGGVQYSTIDSAATYLRSSGGLLFMSAGNDGTYNDSTSYPDWDSFVIVGATNQSDSKSSFSEYGPFVDIAAPGESILTTYLDGSYVYYSGTSFSSPMTAGLGAMLYGINPSFTPDLIESFIFDSVVDLGTTGEDDEYGHGRIDANAALNLALAHTDVPNIEPTAVASSDIVNGMAPLQVVFDGSSSSDEDGSITSYTWDFGDGTNGSGVTVSHTYDSAGTYAAVLTVTDDRGAQHSATPIMITVDPDLSSVVAPSNLSAAVEANSVSLTWQDNASNETGFVLERAKKIRGKYTFAPLEDTIIADSISFTDVVEQTGDYKYRIKAVNDTTESEYSNEVLVKVETIGTTPDPEPDPTPGLTAPTLTVTKNGNSITLSWNDVCPETDTCTYTIERGDSKVRGVINFSTYQTNYLGLSETHTETSGVYYFRVKAHTSQGEVSEFSNVLSMKVR